MAKPTPHLLPSPSSRLIVLRLVLATSLIVLVFYVLFATHLLSLLSIEVNKLPPYAYLPPSIVTLLHHAGSTLGPQRFPMPRWADLFLTVLEAGFHWYMAARFTIETDSWARRDVSLVRSAEIVVLICQWAIAFSLTVFLSIRLADLRQPGWKWRDTAKVADVSHEPWWNYPIVTIFGRKYWDSTVPGEAGWLSITRGVMALTAVGIMLAFGVHQIIISPIAESGVLPFRQFRTCGFAGRSLTSDLLAAGDWTVMVLWVNETAEHKPLTEAVHVAWSYPGHSVGNLSSSEGFCEDPPVPEEQSQCFQARPNSLAESWPAEDLVAIHVQVNFTDMFAEGQRLHGVPSAALNAAHVYIGLGKKFNIFTSATRPVRLYPGTHLLTVMDMIVRQHLKWPSIATLGFESYESTVVLDPVYTIANPFTNISDPGIATLVVTVENKVLKPEWIVVQDFRTKSVLGGFSAVGGLGSFLSTLLVVFVGTSLMRAVMRNRDHSPFGLLHSGMAARMACASRTKYPQLGKDIDRAQSDPGVVAFLFDTMIDMEPLGYHGVDHYTDQVLRSQTREIDEESIETQESSESIVLLPTGSG